MRNTSNTFSKYFNHHTLEYMGGNCVPELNPTMERGRGYEKNAGSKL